MRGGRTLLMLLGLLLLLLLLMVMMVMMVLLMLVMLVEGRSRSRREPGRRGTTRRRLVLIGQ